MKSGQILILVLLVVVVSLAIGLSVASRNLTNLRTSTQTEQSQRAFSAAEGGIEDILSRINNASITGDPNIGTTGHKENVTVGDLQAAVTVSAPNNLYEDKVVLGNVAQIDLADPSNPTWPLAGHSIKVSWSKSGSTEQSNPASVEITIVNKTGAVYSQRRTYWPGGGLPSGGSESDTNAIASDKFKAAITGCGDYYKCTSSNILLQSGDVLVRVKPFWNDATIRVEGVAAYVIPAQTYTVESVVSTTTGVTRRVQVKRTKKPQLPAAFDYVLYSENSITK